MGVLRRDIENNRPWDEITCARAAEGGHLKVLQWLRENNCPWDTFTCAYAAVGGHLEVLKWAREQSYIFAGVVPDELVISQQKEDV